MPDDSDRLTTVFQFALQAAWLEQTRLSDLPNYTLLEVWDNIGRWFCLASAHKQLAEAMQAYGVSGFKDCSTQEFVESFIAASKWGLTVRVAHALLRDGICSMLIAQKLSDDRLLEIRDFGNGALKEIRAALKRFKRSMR